MKKVLILLADGTEEMELCVYCSVVLMNLIVTLRFVPSTITYDTLVRAGASCTSAYVPAQERTETNSTFSNPPFAKGSRGINISPDTYFSPQEASPVGIILSTKMVTS